MTDTALNTVSNFTAGERVQLHPALDAWMSGDRFGTITKVGKSVIAVRLDRSGRLRHFDPKSLMNVRIY